jgi:cytochrome c-type biogenesis protein CcmF
MEWLPADDRLAVTTRLEAFRGGRAIGTLVPERRFYMGREDKPTSEVSIISSWSEDLYVVLTGHSRDGTASFRILVNPMVSLLWAGGFVAGFGALLALWPGRNRSDFKLRQDAQ